MTDTEPVFQRRKWHYGPPVFGILLLVFAVVLLVYGLWITGVTMLLMASAFAFQTWWIWIDIPRTWPYVR